MAQDPGLTADDERRLDELRRAVAAAPSRPTQIEVGIALSITLGRLRPAVSCGGCSVPLDFDGIPATTNARLATPFRLRFDPVATVDPTPGG